MKLLFWSGVILALMWIIGKRKLGQDNDLVAHLQEQRALQSIGKVATAVNNAGTATWPLAELGGNPYSGINIDPLNPYSPFQQPFTPIFGQGQPSYMMF